RIFFPEECEIPGRKRMLLDRNEMQAPAARGIVAPCLPRREERQAEAEPCFEHGEEVPAPPAFGQAVSQQEYVPRLRQAAFRAVIDVAEGFGEGRAIGRER